MDSVVKEMFKHMDQEQLAEETGGRAPDLPNMSKLISQVTSSLFKNPEMQSLLQQPGIKHTSASSSKVLTHNMTVSLSDLYVGCTKTVKMRRQRYNTESGRNVWEKTVLTVAITRGMRHGDTILLEKVGDHLRDNEPGDVEIVLTEGNEESNFVARGDDLVMNVDVGISDMFYYTADVEHLDSQVYTLHHNDKQQALNGEFKVSELGLPRKDGSFGDLIVNVNVVLPVSEADMEAEFTEISNRRQSDKAIVADYYQMTKN